MARSYFYDEIAPRSPAPKPPRGQLISRFQPSDVWSDAIGGWGPRTDHVISGTQSWGFESGTGTGELQVTRLELPAPVDIRGKSLILRVFISDISNLAALHPSFDSTTTAPPGLADNSWNYQSATDSGTLRQVDDGHWADILFDYGTGEIVTGNPDQQNMLRLAINTRTSGPIKFRVNSVTMVDAHDHIPAHPEGVALPSSYTFGKVVTRIVQAVADGSDEDRFPDMLAAGGTITFKPKEKNRKTVNYSALVLNQNIKGTLYVPDPDISKELYPYPPGTLLDSQGNEGVWLVTGNYIAEFQLYEGAFPPLEITVTDANDADAPLDLIHASPTEPPQGVIMVQADIPPGGRPNQTIVTDENGQLAWRDFFDEEFRDEFIGYRDQVQEVYDTVLLPIQVQDTPPESTDVIWVNPNEPAGTASDWALRAEAAAATLGDVGGLHVDTTVGTRVFVGDTMVYGNTGWLDISHLLSEDWVIGSNQGHVRIKRENSTVHLDLRIDRVTAGRDRSSSTQFIDIPAGFRPTPYSNVLGDAELFDHSQVGRVTAMLSAGGMLVKGFTGTWVEGDRLFIIAQWETPNSWPANPPAPQHN